MPRLAVRREGFDTLAEAVYTMRRRAEFSLSDMARKAGVSLAVLSEIELGRVGASVDMCRRIAAAVDGNELLLFWLALRFRSRDLLHTLEDAGFKVELKRVKRKET